MLISNFTGALIAGAIAITTVFAAPVAAANNGNRLARIVLGAAAVSLVAHKVRKEKTYRREVSRRNTREYRNNRTRHHDNRPKTCLRKKYTDHGWKTYYSRRCLSKHRKHRHEHYDARRDNGHANSRRHSHADHGNKHTNSRRHEATKRTTNQNRENVRNTRNINNDYFRKWNDTHN